MHYRCAALWLWVLAFLALALAPDAVPAETPAEQWLIVSDIHFDPFIISDIITAIDLPKPCNTRAYSDIVVKVISIFNDFFCHDGTGANNTHFSP